MKIIKPLFPQGLKSGIYCISNDINDKVYIGSSISLKNRIRNHTLHLNKNSHHSITLQRFYNKYLGKGIIRFTILEACQIPDLIAKEQKWIDYFDSANPKKGYNVCKLAGSSLGRKMEEDTKKKISKFWKENVHPCTGKPNINKGKVLSCEHKEKISKANSGIKNGMFGKKLSLEHRAMLASLGIKEVLQIDEKNKVLKKFKSLTEAARFYALSTGAISRVCSGEYSHTKGYIFRYGDNFFPFKARFSIYRIYDLQNILIFEGRSAEASKFLGITMQKLITGSKHQEYRDNVRIEKIAVTALTQTTTPR